MRLDRNITRVISCDDFHCLLHDFRRNSDGHFRQDGCQELRFLVRQAWNGGHGRIHNAGLRLLVPRVDQVAQDL